MTEEKENIVRLVPESTFLFVCGERDKAKVEADKWKLRYFEARKELQVAGKGIHRLRKGRDLAVHRWVALTTFLEEKGWTVWAKTVNGVTVVRLQTPEQVKEGKKNEN